jgi:hypothetical protein
MAGFWLDEDAHGPRHSARILVLIPVGTSTTLANSVEPLDLPVSLGGSNAVGKRSRYDNAKESDRAIDRQTQGAFNVNIHVFPDRCI